MEIIIKGEPKEIVALERALKSDTDIETVAREFSEKLKEATHFSR